MKRLILILTLILPLLPTYASYKRDGDTFKIEKTESGSSGIQTKYTWEDKEGKVYPIYITKKGACYINKVSKKTGKEYRYYLPKEVQNQIKKELNIQ